MIGKEKAMKILKDTLKKSDADKTELLLMGHHHFLTRYANSQIHQNTFEENATLYIKVTHNQKIGVTKLNNFHPRKIEKALETAMEIAKQQEIIPDLKKIPQPEKFKKLKSFFPRTRDISAEEKALVIQDMISRAHGDRLSLSGAFYTGQNELAILNSQGVEGYFNGTKANIAVIASGNDVNGYAAASSRNVDDIDHIKLIEEALEGAKKYPVKELEPGEYPVILDEYAVSELVMYLAEMAFEINSAEEGKSFVPHYVNEKLFPEQVSIYDDALDPHTFSMPFDYEGVAKKRVDFIKKGVITGDLAYNNYMAQKQGIESTGHGLPPGNGISNSASFHLIMEPGKASQEELFEKMGTGLYVKRFHYLTTVHPLKTILSGMTRDGFFWVENGKITHRVHNMRFTQSIIEALKSVKEAAQDRKLIWFRDFSVNFPITTIIPKLFIEKFNFTGRTEF
ncbi:MAG: TldD/PmbA family protein [Vulcanimicrobiota bacterium]